MPLLRKEQHHQVYVLGICLLAASVPLSRYFMSIAQFILLGNWLLEGNLKNKVKTFFSNKPALVLTSLYLMHFVGLFYTTDWDYAIKDLRTKVPLLLLPLFFSTSAPLSSKQIQWVYNVYILAVIAGTITGITILLNQSITDTREMSPFISHIRFSLNVCLAVVILVSGLKQGEFRSDLRYNLTISVILLWLLFYLYVSQSFTGYFIVAALVFCWLAVWSFSMRRVYLKVALFISVILFPVLSFIYIQHEYRLFFGEKKIQPGKLSWITPSGHWYSHDTLSKEVISGNPVWLYVSKEEMRSVWNRRSLLAFDSMGRSGLKIEDVLIRYLTSKGYHKDSTGVSLLRPDEIRNIENGVADVEETRGSPLHKRLRKIFWEYQNYISSGDPSGHSVMMRLEYWKASLGLISQHPLTGVGTGDMNKAFNQYYSNHNSKLKPEWRRRSHNQFLSIAVGFGVFGLVWFLFALVYPPVKLNRFKSFLFGSFFMILILSMLAEDTIESQDGVTFAAFFFSFLLFVDKEKPANFD